MVDWDSRNGRCNASLTKTDEAEGRIIRENVSGRSANESIPLCIVWREEKQKVVQKKGLMVVIVVPMLQRIAKDAPEYIMSSEDWTK